MPDTPELNVPIIDLSKVDNKGDEDAAVVQSISQACREYGFFQVINHGIAASLVEEYLEQCRRYFALPREMKLKWKRGENNSRGYFDDELTKNKRDWKEAFDFGVPGQRQWSVPDDDENNKCLDGWNQFPSENELDGYRTVATTYFDACAELADRIATLMAKGLGAGADVQEIQELRENHTSYLRSNYYPPCEDTEQNLGISPHRDAGFLTVLLQDVNTHSLQVWKDGHWITVHPEPGAFTINTGDMAQIFSNGLYKAPLHRVLANESHERYSAPFFYNPSYEKSFKPFVSPAQQTNGVLLDSIEKSTPPSSSSLSNKASPTTDTNTDAKILYHECIWGYFRAVRFAGDLTDLGVEIQVEDFLKDGPLISPHIEKQNIFAQQADFNIPFSVEQYRPLLQE